MIVKMQIKTSLVLMAACILLGCNQPVSKEKAEKQHQKPICKVKKELYLKYPQPG